MAERFLELVFRLRLLLMLPILLGSIGGVLALSLAGSNYYVSRAAIWVERPSDLSGGALSEFNQYISPAQNQGGSMQELLGTNSFARKVLMGVYPNDPNRDYFLTELRTNTFVYPNGQHVLYIEYRSADPVIAQKTVDSIIKTYASLYTEQVADRAGRSKTFYEEQLAAARTQVEFAQNDLRAYIAKTPALAGVNLDNPTPAQLRDLNFSQLISSAESNRDNYDRLLDKYAESQIEESAASGAAANFLVLDEPDLPLFPVMAGKKSLLLPPIMGLASGVFISSLAFVVYWRLDRRVHLLKDLDFLGSELPVMALPKLKARRRRWPSSFVRAAMAMQNGLKPKATVPQSILLPERPV